MRGRDAPHVGIDVDVLLARGVADAGDIVDVELLALAERHRRRDEGVRHRMAERGLPRRDHAGAAADGGFAAGIALHLLEIADDGVVAPTRPGGRLPAVVVGLVTLEPDRRIDAGAAADDLADRRHDHAVVEMRLRGGFVAPVGVGAEVARVDARVGDFFLFDVGAAAFDQQHGGAAVLRQPVRHDAAGGARADDDEVVLALEIGERRTLDGLREDGVLGHVARSRRRHARGHQRLAELAAVDPPGVGRIDQCIDGLAVMKIMHGRPSPCRVAFVATKECYGSVRRTSIHRIGSWAADHVQRGQPPTTNS